MLLTLSKSSITSYCGDVLPLHLGFDSEMHAILAKAEIKWASDSDSVMIRSFSGDDEMNFNNGVLLILKKLGSATVTATLEGTVYSCSVTVREPKTASSDDKLDFFIGDLHNHTTNIHNYNKFKTRTSEFQYEFIEHVKNEGQLDFCAMSDHALILNDTEFFRNFVEVEKAEPNSIVIFPGAESEVTLAENDRFGILHKNSGEIVTFNVDKYGACPTWDLFCECLGDAPQPIAIFAHPNVIGYSVKGIWNFCFHKNNTPEMLRAMRGIETINGGNAKGNVIHEFNYSLALDSGFRVSSVASSDSHGPVWGYRCMKPKTVILAPEKSREAFVDAIRNNRFYATESGDVKLRYSVNGRMAPADLDLSDVYRFHVEISSFNNDESAVPISCSVISDGGRSLISLTEIGSVLDFEIHSETARYFYLRLVDREGRRTWSMPVWTGRDFDRFVEPQLIPVDMSKAVAIDLLDGGADASGAIDGNVLNVWEAKSGRASVLIDLNDIRTLSALGNYPRIVSRGETPEQRASWREEDYTSTFPTAYAIYTSIDGADYVKRAEGIFRMFGGEEIITFESCRARFVRLDIMSTSGADSIPLLFREARCSIANLTLFE